MKLGLIVEGIPDGRVCQRAAERLVPEIEGIEVRMLGRKPDLIRDCGQAAAALLQDSACDRVVIVWDLYPNWKPKKFKACRKEDRAAVRASLSHAGLSGDGRVRLTCIARELEAWLIGDRDAIRTVLHRYIGSDKTAKVRGHKQAERHPDPKGCLEDMFEEFTPGNRYIDREHAGAIIDAIRDLKSLSRIQSFKHFAEKVLGAGWP